MRYIRSKLKRACPLLLILAMVLQLGFSVTVGAAGGEILQVGHLLTNGVAQPQAIDPDVPVFSWQIEAAGRGVMQSAYEIVVKELLSGETVWDSGKVADSQSASVKYDGPALTPDTSYTWQVCVWDQNDVQSEFSTAAQFRVGLAKEDWTAEYIWDGTENENNFAYFRNTFQVEDKEIAEAVVYTSAHNDYQLFLNGEFLGAGPARSNPLRYGQYCAYDITDELQQGDNTFASLAHWHGVWYDSGVNASPAYILEARIRYTDGTTQTITTDESWKVLSDTAYLETDPVYFGFAGGVNNRPSIRYDARLEPDGWQAVEFDDSAWTTATEVDRSDYNLYAQLVGEQTEMERETPVSHS